MQKPIAVDEAGRLKFFGGQTAQSGACAAMLPNASTPAELDKIVICSTFQLSGVCELQLKLTEQLGATLR